MIACDNKLRSPNEAPGSEPPETPVPEFVYVPAPGFRVEVTIFVPPHLKVGQPIRLRARRESIGEWQKVRYSSLPPDAMFFSVPGPNVEPEVAANLTWFTDPPRAAKFDTGLQSLALGMEREAIFHVPGTVQIWAITATPLRQRSNTVQVEVER